MNARDKMSDPVDSISFTAMNYKFSITLNDLTPNTMYFYHVTSANSIQSISSQVQNFTTGSEGSMYISDSRITTVYFLTAR